MKKFAIALTLLAFNFNLTQAQSVKVKTEFSIEETYVFNKETSFFEIESFVTKSKSHQKVNGEKSTKTEQITTTEVNWAFALGEDSFYIVDLTSKIVAPVDIVMNKKQNKFLIVNEAFLTVYSKPFLEKIAAENVDLGITTGNFSSGPLFCEFVTSTKLVCTRTIKAKLKN